MKIEVKNCNSIEHAAIDIEPQRLNIKYGPNGTGKSTIAKAIQASIQGGAELQALTPFKHLGKQDGAKPEVLGADVLKSVLIFNEDYVRQFVFQQDEVVKNSFEIFIKSPDFDQKMAAIEASFAAIKDAFKKNQSIELVLNDLNELSDSFGKSQSGIAKSGRLSKALAGGNKLQHIPEKLLPYSTFIKSDASIKWISWQLKGHEFLEVGTDCPYCATSVEGRKETILAVCEEYDAKSIEHLVGLQAVFDRLGKYLEAECRATVAKILQEKEALKSEAVTYLLGLKAQVDTLREKLFDLRSLSFFSLRDIDAVEDKIKGLKIDLGLLHYLKSEETGIIVSEINASLENVLQSAGKLKGEINKQKQFIQSAIARFKGEINTFLYFAGYRYMVDIQPDGETYKMRLLHADFSKSIEHGSKHLSFGERNAFAIVLFMYECLMKNPDLIILDDPISSFDRSKKFAMLEMLFRGTNSLRSRTVLMLTHDLEPVIDLVKCLSHTFQPTPVAGFLVAKSGSVAELAVKKNDIQSFAQICRQNIEGHPSDVIKAIYLRRHYEILDDRGMSYQMLSSVLKNRPTPTVKDPSEGSHRDMTLEEMQEATVEIGKLMPDFSYAKVVGQVADRSGLKAAYFAAESGYERLQIFRVLCGDNHENSVVKKYINEAFHIENEHVMQLNPQLYDSVPPHIIAECNEVISSI